MAPELDLGGLQRWMQSVVVHRGPVAAALAEPEAASLVPPERLSAVLLPSAGLSAAERIAIYQGMYPLRMAEALQSDYPGLAHFLGEQRWARLVREYVSDHPSRSYTLNVLGRYLPDWLGTHGPRRRRGFCHDLARLEWAVVEAFDADESPRLAPGAIESLPPDAWAAARLVPSACVRLVALRWNANEYLDSTKGEGHDHPKPLRRPSRVVVYRRSYSVYRRELSREAFRLLSDLFAGRPLGKAVSLALRRRDAPTPDTLRRWFAQWAADGVFTRIDVGESEPA
jgi:hypothetical protein